MTCPHDRIIRDLITERDDLAAALAASQRRASRLETSARAGWTAALWAAEQAGHPVSAERAREELAALDAADLGSKGGGTIFENRARDS